MNESPVSELLRKLHDTLAGATSPAAISAKDRKLLEQLAQDIQTMLARPDAPASKSPRTLADQLQVAVTRFEVTHPDLTATMARAAKTLADMGI